MTDDQFQTIVDRAHELQGTSLCTYLRPWQTDDRLTFGAWREAIEEHVARVVANIKARSSTTIGK